MKPQGESRKTERKDSMHDANVTSCIQSAQDGGG